MKSPYVHATAHAVPPPTAGSVVKVFGGGEKTPQFLSCGKYWKALCPRGFISPRWVTDLGAVWLHWSPITMAMTHGQRFRQLLFLVSHYFTNIDSFLTLKYVPPPFCLMCLLSSRTKKNLTFASNLFIRPCAAFKYFIICLNLYYAAL